MHRPARAAKHGLLLLLPALGGAAGRQGQGAGGHDWTRFGWDPGRSSAPTGAMGITAADLPALRH